MQLFTFIRVSYEYGLLIHSTRTGSFVALILTSPRGYRGGSSTAVQDWQPSLCGSCPLVTPYYCRLRDLLCYTSMLYLSTFLCVYPCVFCVFFVLRVVFLYSFFLQYFDTVGWVFWPVKTVSHITYTVLEGRKTLHNPIQFNQPLYNYNRTAQIQVRHLQFAFFACNNWMNLWNLLNFAIYKLHNDRKCDVNSWWWL